MSRQRKPLGAAPPLGSAIPSEERMHLETVESAAPLPLRASAEPVPPLATSRWDQPLAETAASAKIPNPAAAAAAAADRGKHAGASTLGLAPRFSSRGARGGGSGSGGTGGARSSGARDGTPTARPERRPLGMPASSSLTLADRRMRDLLQSRRLEPGQDPNVSLGRARYAIVKHAVRARLAEREIKDLAADILKLSLSAASGSLPRARDKEPRVRGMVDVNRAAMSVLEQRGLRYKQYSFKSASGWFTYRVHLLDPNAVTKLIVEDPALASVLSVPTTEQVRLQHEQAKAEGAQRKYGSVLSSDSYACEQAPRGKLLFSYDAFADGTSRRGAKHLPIIYYCNHLDVDVRFRAEAGGGAIVGGYAEIFRVPATDPR